MISQNDFEIAKTEYIETLPALTELNKQKKELNTKQKERKAIITQYMKQEHETSLELGGFTFELQEKERIPINMSLLEELIPDRIQQIKEDYKVVKEILHVRKPKRARN